ncbi:MULTISPECIES: outer membrane protein assembly factor BamC [Methylomonas]|uniref:outer membrane protein assembly factor BamC n=1 Tax=Methylomonas TaxID=416 RepID=UPI0012321722|nr:outer membrane protein assembly factor BamC [Methylomonas rhizoryzae]
MRKLLTVGLPALLLGACADTSERYRDTHQLELPPELPIEHTHVQEAVAVDDLKPKATAASSLAGLIELKDDEKSPKLILKTRPDRAWEMVVVALKLCNTEVIDKNREELKLQVRYDPDSACEEQGIWDALMHNDYAEAEYTLKLKEDAYGVNVTAGLSKPDDLEFGEDGSPRLIRLLHKTMDEKIIHREQRKKPEQE